MENKLTYKIEISKSNINWICILLMNQSTEACAKQVDEVTADSYTDLMHKVGLKGWIDLINNQHK